MREIKFRAWDRIDKRMIYSKLFLSKFFKHVENRNMLSFVMQFTGLKDKNGEEIFEGDILQSYPTKDVRFLVGFGENEDNNCFGFNLKSLINSSTYVLETSISKMEVIGNKFENPELLK